MTDRSELYPVNTIPPVTWAMQLYFKRDFKFKDPGTIELVFPAGDHKELLQKKGDHRIVLWFTDRKVFVRARCTYSSDCDFNSQRVRGGDREGMMVIPWEGTDDRAFFRAVTKWLLRIKFEYVPLIRSLTTVCDRYVEIPMTTKYGRTFEKFDEYRRNRWPKDAKPTDRPRFLEEVLVRVCFWIQSASDVDALHPPT